MTKRGKVLRDPFSGPGLLIAEGRQFQYMLNTIWKSGIPPTPGLVVDIEFDVQGKIAAITAIPDSQLAKEQAEVTIGGDRRRTSPRLIARLTRSGPIQFIAAALLILSWFSLTAISVEAPLTGTLELTFWQLLRYLGSAAYRLGGLIAVIGPFVRHFWKDRQAAFGGLLPLSFMLLIFVVVFRDLDVLGASGGYRFYQLARNQAREELLSAISLGLGAYMSVIIGLYFAFLSVSHFRQSKQSERKAPGQLQKATA